MVVDREDDTVFFFLVYFDKLKCTEMDYELFGRFCFTQEDVLNHKNVPLM